MPAKNNKHEALLRQIDSIIENQTKENSGLRRDLQKFRADLKEAQKTRNNQEIALILLRIASWIKFFFENIPPVD